MNFCGCAEDFSFVRIIKDVKSKLGEGNLIECHSSFYFKIDLEEKLNQKYFP